MSKDVRTKIDPAIVHLAAELYGDLRRSGSNKPFFNHPIEVASLVAEAGGDEVAVAAAYLHDVIEDCEISEDELRHRLTPICGSGLAIAIVDVVGELTDDPNLSKPEQKQAQIDSMPYKSSRARLVKMADKLSNTSRLHTEPPGWRRSSIIGYARGNKKVIDAGRGTSPLLEARFDAVFDEVMIHYGEQP